VFVQLVGLYELFAAIGLVIQTATSRHASGAAEALGRFQCQQPLKGAPEGKR
jgi:hypothetical protein